MYQDNFSQITAAYVAYLNDFQCNCSQKQIVGGNPDVSEKDCLSNMWLSIQWTVGGILSFHMQKLMKGGMV